MDDWLRNLSNNLTLNSFLFDTVALTRNAIEDQFIYSDWGIAISWNFDNDVARSAASFGVDDSSPSHTNNCKNIFLVLGDGPTEDIYDNLDTTDKKFSINSTKAKAIVFTLHSVVMEIICICTKQEFANLMGMIPHLDMSFVWGTLKKLKDMNWVKFY